MSFQIFAISERSKVWKQIAGKILKANRWKNFESFLKANRWKIFESFLKAQELAKFWKQIAGKFLKANRWKMFERKSLENFWKQIAGKFLKANRWRFFESKTLAKIWKLFERSAILFCKWLRYASDEFLCICARKSWDLLIKASHKEKYIDAGQKKMLFCRPATCVPVNNCKNKRTCQHAWL